MAEQSRVFITAFATATEQGPAALEPRVGKRSGEAVGEQGKGEEAQQG